MEPMGVSMDDGGVPKGSICDHETHGMYRCTNSEGAPEGSTPWLWNPWYEWVHGRWGSTRGLDHITTHARGMRGCISDEEAPERAQPHNHVCTWMHIRERERGRQEKGDKDEPPWLRWLPWISVLQAPKPSSKIFLSTSQVYVRVGRVWKCVREYEK